MSSYCLMETYPAIFVCEKFKYIELYKWIYAQDAKL